MNKEKYDSLDPAYQAAIVQAVEEAIEEMKPEMKNIDETSKQALVDGDLNEGRIVCKFSTGSHSGVMVPVYAFGPGAENFFDIFENTDIFWKIKKLLNL